MLPVKSDLIDTFKLTCEHTLTKMWQKQNIKCIWDLLREGYFNMNVQVTAVSANRSEKRILSKLYWGCQFFQRGVLGSEHLSPFEVPI